MPQSMGSQVVGQDLVIKQQQQGKRVLFFALVTVYEDGCKFPKFFGGDSYKKRKGTSLVVQWLRVQGTWVQYLVGELRSHMVWSM